MLILLNSTTVSVVAHHDPVHGCEALLAELQVVVCLLKFLPELLKLSLVLTLHVDIDQLPLDICSASERNQCMYLLVCQLSSPEIFLLQVIPSGGCDGGGGCCVTGCGAPLGGGLTGQQTRGLLRGTGGAVWADHQVLHGLHVAYH
jgi:hypothetical protein